MLNAHQNGPAGCSIILPELAAGAKKRITNEAHRRLHNRAVAIRLAKAGIYVLPASSTKLPMIPSYNVADSSLNGEQREQIAVDYTAKHSRPPVHVGATCDVATVRRIWDTMPDAVPGIACGPSKLVVVDADKKHNGPRKLTALIREKSIKVDQAPITETGSGGLHLIFSGGDHTNAAGGFGDLGCDIRGRGGFIVAPGAWLETGKKYTAMPGAADLADSFVLGTIPEMPTEFQEVIGSARAGEQSATAVMKERASTSATETLIREAIIAGTLNNGEMLLSEPAFGFGPATLAEKYPLVADAMSDEALGTVDHSAARFALVSAWRSEGATPLEIAAMLMSGEIEYAGEPVSYRVVTGKDGSKRLLEAKPAAGLYDTRAISRDISRAHVHKDHSKAFGAVEDDAHAIEVTTKPRERTLWGYDAHRDYKPMEWLVDGLIPAQGVGVFYGDGNVGKSFAGIDMLNSAKRGAKWFGRDTVQGGAMYICAEGQAGLGSRLKALYDEHPVSSRYESIAVRGDLPVFGDRPKVAAKMIERMIAEAALESGEPIKVVFLDNLSRMEGSIEENAQGDMTQIFTALGELSRKLDLVFVIAHHTTKGGETYRGSTAIRNSADFMLSVTEDGSGIRTIKINKMRDAAKGEAVKFKLKVREVGTNQFGKPVTSCVVVPATAADVSGVMGEADDVERVPDDLAGRVAALAKIVRRLSANNEVGLALGKVLKAWNAARAGQADVDGEPLPRIEHIQMKRAIKLGFERGKLREIEGRLHCV